MTFFPFKNRRILQGFSFDSILEKPENCFRFCFCSIFRTERFSLPKFRKGIIRLIFFEKLDGIIVFLFSLITRGTATRSATIPFVVRSWIRWNHGFLTFQRIRNRFYPNIDFCLFSIGLQRQSRILSSSNIMPNFMHPSYYCNVQNQ